jgi:hypothetical protein
MVLYIILQKLKDKKQAVLLEVQATVKKFHYSITLDDMFEDLRELLEDKVKNYLLK